MPYFEEGKLRPIFTQFDKRQEYWINKRGYESFELSPDSLRNQSVRRYVGITVDADRLGGSLYVEAHRHDEGKSGSGYSYLVENGRAQSPSPTLIPSIGLRLMQADRLGHVMNDVLGEAGLYYTSRMDELIFSSLSSAVEPFDLKIDYSPVELIGESDDHNGENNRYRRGIWVRDATTDNDDRRFISNGKEYGHYAEGPEYVFPDKRTSPAEMQDFERVAQELDIPTKYREEDRTIGFVHTLIEARDFLHKVEGALKEEEAPGLIPSMNDRLSSVLNVTKVIIALLETGFKGKTIDQSYIIQMLNDALTTNYGITVSRNPQTENLLDK